MIKRFILFVVVSVLIIVAFTAVQSWLAPDPAEQPKPVAGENVGKVLAVLNNPDQSDALTWLGAYPVPLKFYVAPVTAGASAKNLLAAHKADAERKPPPVDKVVAVLRDGSQSSALTWLAAFPEPFKFTLSPGPTGAVLAGLVTAKTEETPDRDITIGEGPDFKLKVDFSSRYAAVRRITLKNFKAASYKHAKPEDKPLVLVGNKDHMEFLPHGKDPGSPEDLSFRLLRKDGSEIRWKEQGEVRRTPEAEEIVFQGTLEGSNVTVIKTFRLETGQYHVKMNLDFKSKNPQAKCDYVLTGPFGVPIEGEVWQTRPPRRVVLGAMEINDPGSIRRVIHEPKLMKEKLLQENHLAAKSESLPNPPYSLQYAGVTAQYFAALAVVNGDPVKNLYIEKVEVDYEGSFDPDKYDLMGKIRLLSLPVDLANGERDEDRWHHIEHEYLLYAGPAKVRLLAWEEGLRPYKLPDGTEQPLPEFYGETLHLNKLTDYSEYWWTGYGWTQILVFFTNLMHWLLEFLQAYVVAPILGPGHYWLAIILLTILVRLAMFPLSRKQALMGQRMQKLQPELKKFQEKLKNDRAALAQAQMDLYRKHGVNPFSGCLPVLVQMPIFMGLYYALNESVHLRLASFLWIENLAAPDMLLNWEHWPLLGALVMLPHSLGPFLNLLPIVSVGLMVMHQKLVAPPPVDEQQAMQMKVMNFMMIFIGYMFYWVPAGLCLYFCISSGWALVERKLLPKRQTATDTAPQPAKAPVSNDRARRPAKDGDLPNWRRQLGEWWSNLMKQAKKK